MSQDFFPWFSIGHRWKGLRSCCCCIPWHSPQSAGCTPAVPGGTPLLLEGLVHGKSIVRKWMMTGEKSIQFNKIFYFQPSILWIPFKGNLQITPGRLYRYPVIVSSNNDHGASSSLQADGCDSRSSIPFHYIQYVYIYICKYTYIIYIYIIMYIYIYIYIMYIYI